MNRLLALVVFCFLAAAAPAQETIHRSLAGEPGVRITLSQPSMALVATSPSAPGVEDVTAPPPEPHTVSWPSRAGQVTVTLYQQPGETDDGITIRLARRVTAMQKSFPPINQ